MKPPVLIVRTVSIEKLSPLLDVCRKRWPLHPLIVATNPGRESELRADSRITDVVSCPTNGDGFSTFISFDQKLIAVVVPVANANGSGYANAMRACRTLRTERYMLASYARELHTVGRFTWGLRWQTELCLEGICGRIAKAWVRRLLKQVDGG